MGTAHAYGSSMDEALRSVTLSTAEILGVADRAAVWRKGDATLVIMDGNILDIRTNVEAAFIQGRRVDLSDRHKSCTTSMNNASIVRRLRMPREAY